MAVYIIAEAGVNHNGDPAIARQLVDAAIDAGADAVKFQTFKADRLATAEAEACDYQKKNTGEPDNQLEMLRSLELADTDFVELSQYCATRGIDFLSTGFDVESLLFLLQETNMKRVKIPSGEMGNPLLLLSAARSGLPIILSTGLATLQEVEASLAVVAYGLLNDTGIPSQEQADHCLKSADGATALRQQVTILHCVTDYPARLEDMNIKAMTTLADSFDTPIGLSDHSAGILAPTIAVARGACLIEKHFTLDKAMHGPDHQASLDPDEFTLMVAQIRAAEKALGTGIKKPVEAELENLEAVRGSLVAKTAIVKDDILGYDNVAVKRPATGLAPMKFLALAGKPATRNYDKDELLDQ